jgi:uncharacterized protein with von Willebrand factor type A (vWA) domain
MTEQPGPASCGGVIHTYRGYDPVRFPLPAAKPPDLVTPAFEHMLEYGSLRHFSEEELAQAIELDPSQITGLGPSISSLLAMLEERRRRILETWETSAVRRLADAAVRGAAAGAAPPRHLRERFERAVREEQIADLERLWYEVDESGRRPGAGRPARPPRREARGEAFAGQLLHVMERLGEKYEVEKLAANSCFTGRREMDVPTALRLKEELETIDRLIRQLQEAAKNARLYTINLEELARFASEEQIQGLDALRRQVEDMLRHLAEEQGLRSRDGRLSLSPKAFKLFQSRLLDTIFSQLQASRTGRHHVELTGDGAVELQRTRPWEFGDSLANMDVPGTLINALIRERMETPGEGDGPAPQGIRLRPEDIEIHLTRNTPKCASVVCMDMSGSMRWGGAYVDVKRMALALHGLIRTEYPGDFVDFIEIATLPRRRHISEVPALLPKPVTLHDPCIRLKADMSDDRITARDIPPHFTNIQHGLALARRMLQVQDTPNRQIILITDGLPTAHFEDNWLYLLYPPDRRTEHHTLREAGLCRRQGITLNIFLLASWSQDERDVRFAHRMAEETGGRVMFVAGRELDRYVVWDYLSRRRFIAG